MKQFDPIPILNSFERWAVQTLAARGWQLERKSSAETPSITAVLASGRFPLGAWEYTWHAVGGSEPFKMETFTRWVETRLDPQRDDETVQQCQNLRKFLIAIWASREAVERGNTSAGLAIGMLIQRYMNEFKIPIYIEAGIYQQVADAGRQKIGKYGPLRRMLICMTEMIGNTDNYVIFKHWQKANPDKEFFGCDTKGKDETWQLEAERVTDRDQRAGIDADDIRLEDFKYLYYHNRSEHPKLATTGAIQKTLERIRENC